MKLLIQIMIYMDNPDNPMHIIIMIFKSSLLKPEYFLLQYRQNKCWDCNSVTWSVTFDVTLPYLGMCQIT